jgi:dihydroxyacetone kinase-like protein
LASCTCSSTPRQWLERKSFRITRSLIGNVTTSLEMAGASLTLCVLDDQIKRHWDTPVHTPSLRWGA